MTQSSDSRPCKRVVMSQHIQKKDDEIIEDLPQSMVDMERSEELCGAALMQPTLEFHPTG